MYLHTEQIDFDTMDQQQAVFGTQDEYIRNIEKALSVSIGLRDSKVEIEGEENVNVAANVVNSLMELHSRGEALNMDIVYRILEEAKDGDLDSTFKAMDNIVALTNKGVPIRCKTFGQKNYVKALQDNVVTICIGPAGTGKTFLAVAQAVKELKEGKIERIIMSRPAIEAGEERLGFLPGDLAQKVDPICGLYMTRFMIFWAQRELISTVNGVISKLLHWLICAAVP